MDGLPILQTCPPSTMASVQEFFSKYRSLDCSCCHKLLAIQNRLSPSVLLCSPQCVANYNGDSLSDAVSLCSVGSSSVSISPDKALPCHSSSSSQSSWDAAKKPVALAKDSEMDSQKSVQTAVNTCKGKGTSDDSPVSSNNLETNGHSSSVHSDTSLVHSAGKKGGRKNKNNRDPSQLFKREGIEKHRRFPSGRVGISALNLELQPQSRTPTDRIMRTTIQED